MEGIRKISMLGEPSVTVRGHSLVFPYRQAEAIFYYLAENGSSRRNTLAGLVWEEAPSEEKRNANLRNALYTIRKIVGDDVICKEANDVICLNPNGVWEIDVRRFEVEPDNLSLYRGDFLEGFYLKNNVSFNRWISDTRQNYKNIYLKRLRAAIEVTFAGGEMELCENLCRRQMALDECEETSCQYLMRICIGRGEYGKAMQMYNHFERLLAEELFQSPSGELQRLAADAESCWRQERRQKEEYSARRRQAAGETEGLRGREKEQGVLERTLQLFEEERETPHVLISGEEGSGKTRLLDFALQEAAHREKLLLLSSRCCFAEDKYILRLWQRPALQLTEYLEQDAEEEAGALRQSMQALFPFIRTASAEPVDTARDDVSARNAFIDACIRFSETQPLLFCFDDLQWADRASLSLLRDFILRLPIGKDRHILFLLAARDDCDGEVRALFERLFDAGQLQRISLASFDGQETARAIRQRIHLVPAEYRKVLDLISVFCDGISYPCLAALSQKEDPELMEILDDFLERHLLREEYEAGDLFFFFTDQRIQKLVYEEISWSRKRFLHEKAGEYFEGALRGDSSDLALYPKLIYHFEQSGCQEKYFRYVVRYLYGYLNVTHEFFPVLDRQLTLFNLDMREETDEALTEDLTAAEQLLLSTEGQLDQLSRTLRCGEGAEEALDAVSDLLHMMGRYYIRNCQYEKGMKYIARLREMNLAHPSSFRTDKLLQANRQLACVYINRYETEPMRKVVGESLALLEGSGRREEIGIWKRLQGFSEIMDGNPEAGTEALQEAIEIFQASPEREKHRYNLAAAYAWLGEVHRHQGEYEKALHWYERAISVCGDHFLVNGTAIFHTYAGMACFDAGKREQAETYLDGGISLYRKGSLIWGRSMAYSYKALCLLTQGRRSEAEEHLRTAWNYADRLESRYEKGIVCRICAQIRAGVFDAVCPGISRDRQLPRSLSCYCQKARQYFEGVYSPVDLDYLRQISRNEI